MNKLITTLATIAALTVSAHAEDKATTRAPNVFGNLSQAECTAANGAKWKESETWTRQSDGKVRTSKARCTFDAKAAKAILAAKLAH